MSQLLLKMIFYMTTGVIMANISWSTISHASVTGDYVLAIILLGAMFFIVGMFIVDRCQPELSERDFHPTKPWKTPYVTTRRGLWKRVAFITLFWLGPLWHSGLRIGVVNHSSTSVLDDA